MKKTQLILVTIVLGTLIGCINKDSHDVTTVNNTTNNYNGNGQGNPNTSNNPTSLTLLNIQIGSITLWAGDTNKHWTTRIQDRSEKVTKRMQPLYFTWETSTAVFANVQAVVRDYTNNYYVCSSAMTPANDDYFGKKGSIPFSPELLPGKYILTIVITLSDPTDRSKNQTYEYIYPLRIEQ